MGEKKLDVAAKMVDAVGGDGGAALGFGEDERTLKNGLGVEGEALGGPVGVDAVLVNGFGDVGLDVGGVIADAFVAGVAKKGMCVVDLLHHGADEAGELRELTLEECFAEVDVAEDTVEWIGQEVEGRGGKEAAGDGAPVLGGFEGEVFLAFEVMEEAALGETGGFADVFDACGGVTFGADDVKGGVEKLGFRVVFGNVHLHTH